MADERTPGAEGHEAAETDPAAESADDPTLDEAVGEAAAPGVEDVEFPELAMGEAIAASPNIERLLDVRLSLTVELGRRRMVVQDVLNLGQGSILDLQKNSSEPVDVLINGKLLAHGEVVVIDDNFGVRITSLVGPIERVKAMSASEEDR